MVWVDKFKNSVDTLGKIVYDTMESRCSCWEISEEASRPPPRPQQPGNERADRGKGAGRLCPDYNMGTCQCPSNCQKGDHRCNMMMGPAMARKPCGKPHPANQHVKSVEHARFGKGRGKDKGRGAGRHGGRGRGKY